MRPVSELKRLQALQEELFGLAQVMLGLLEQGQLDPLQDAWEKRQRLFSQVYACYRELQPLFAAWDQTLAGLTPAEAQQAAGLVEDIAGQARRVLELDERSKVLLQEQLAKLGQGLDQVRVGQKLVKAYRTIPTLGRGLPERLSRVS